MGLKPKPEIVEDDAKSKEDFNKWVEMNEKAKAELPLSQQK